MPIQTRQNENPEPIKIVDYEQVEEMSFDSPVQVVDDISEYVADLAFMAEPVEVMILPSQDKNDSTQLVSISVNGTNYYMLRGAWQVVPRFVLEVIVRAKRETWQFGYRKAAGGSTFETSSAYNILRYPHHYRDKNPKGQVWYDSIKDQRV